MFDEKSIYRIEDRPKDFRADPRTSCSNQVMTMNLYVVIDSRVDLNVKNRFYNLIR